MNEVLMELCNRINSNKLSVNSFFTVSPHNPFADMKTSIVSRHNYYEDFNVITDKTFLHLSKLARVSMDDSIKLLVVTGYRGTGKTNFLHLCKAIIENDTFLKPYLNVQHEIKTLYSQWSKGSGGVTNEPGIFDEEQLANAQNEIKTLDSNFDKAFEEIRKVLRIIWKNVDSPDARISLSAYLNNSLSGKVIYFDFDAGKIDEDAPLQIKLTREIEEHLKHINQNCIKLFYEFYNRNSSEITNAFENRFDYFVKYAVELIYQNRTKQYALYSGKFLGIAKNLDVDQLLCIEILLELSEIVSQKKDNKVFYIIDNIDMISGDNNTILLKTIRQFWNFVLEMQSLMHVLRKNGNIKDTLWIEAYSRFKFVFSMRETTAMHIGDHLRTRIHSYADHIDISLDVNRSFIIKKRFNVLYKLVKDNLITNPEFIKIAQDIERLTEDKFFKWTFFLLFNNDYRTVLSFLCNVCNAEETPVDISYPFLSSNEPHMIFGGRGIMIKALCDTYKTSGYFRKLRITAKGQKYADYPFNITLIRIILTVLFNLEEKKQKTDTTDTNSEALFFVMKENSVSIKELFDTVFFLCGKERNAQIENYLNCLEAMFSGRTWNYWNHLVTFDNVLRYEKNEFKASVNGEEGEKDIYIRCTKAGEQFIKTLCIHFEYFSCRYAAGNRGLFAPENYTKQNGKYPFEDLISTVFSSAKSCCHEVKRLNETIIGYLQYENYDEFRKSDFHIDRKFHEERVVHGHISYLEAYRLFLINGPLKNDVRFVNEFITGYIKEYLNLLYLDEEKSAFYSENSEILHKELSSCIMKIEDNKYYDISTRITRKYYRTVLEKQVLETLN